MKQFLSILIFLSFLVCSTNAQEIQRPESYNYKQGVEALQNNDLEKALEFLNKELQEHKDNGYAFVWLAVIRNHLEEYGKALTAANSSIRYIPKEDSVFRALAFSTRGDVFLALEEKEKALADYSSTIEILPNAAGGYEKRAEFYFTEKKYNLSDKDYQRIIALDPGRTMGYMGLGRNAKKQEKYEEAISQFNYVIKLAPDYAQGYSFRAESYMFLKKYNEAMDDVITALDIDRDKKAFYLLQDLADSAQTIVTAKLKVQINKHPNDYYWPYCLGIIHERSGQYPIAIKYYKTSLSKEISDVICERIADCLNEAGDYKQALAYINQAIQLDSTYNYYLMQKANIEYNAGMTKEAIADLDRYISNEPDHYSGYYRRGWFKDNTEDMDGAIEDYTMSIVLEPAYAYAYMNRGILYWKKNNKDAAVADFKKTIELDTVPNDNSSAQYAYLYLGQITEAKEWMNKVLEKSTDKGNYYDAACLYSVIGEKEQAIDYLRLALEKGFRRFAHIERDNDLNNIRKLPAFKELLDKYKRKHLQEVQDLSDKEQLIDNYIVNNYKPNK